MTVGKLVSIVALITAIVSSVYAVEKRFTPRVVLTEKLALEQKERAELEQVVMFMKEQLDIDKIQSRIEYLERRIYDIHYEYGTEPQDEFIRKTLLDYKLELDRKKKELDKLMPDGS